MCHSVLKLNFDTILLMYVHIMITWPFPGICRNPAQQRGERGRRHARAHLQDDHAGQVHLVGAAQVRRARAEERRGPGPRLPRQLYLRGLWRAGADVPRGGGEGAPSVQGSNSQQT